MDLRQAKQQYFEQGFFVVDDAVDPNILDWLEAAGRRVVDKVRSGLVDVSGQGPDARGVIGLIAPEFGERDFVDYYTATPLTGYVEEFLGRELRMGVLVLWCVEESGYDSGWHRDIGPPRDADLDADAEMAVLNEPFDHFKWQLALVDDPCLWVVPGSHVRNRTEAETAVLRGDRRSDLPGQVQVNLKRGQTVFWEGKLLHRGSKPEGLRRRLSLAGSYKKYIPGQELEDPGDTWRWMLADNIRDFLPPKAHILYDRWRAVQKG